MFHETHAMVNTPDYALITDDGHKGSSLFCSTPILPSGRDRACRAVFWIALLTLSIEHSIAPNVDSVFFRYCRHGDSRDWYWRDEYIVNHSFQLRLCLACLSQTKTIVPEAKKRISYFTVQHMAPKLRPPEAQLGWLDMRRWNSLFLRWQHTATKLYLAGVVHLWCWMHRYCKANEESYLATLFVNYSLLQRRCVTNHSGYM